MAPYSRERGFSDERASYRTVSAIVAIEQTLSGQTLVPLLRRQPTPHLTTLHGRLDLQCLAAATALA
jgi:hypothetical protein